jgi:hypothetical protein
VLERARKAIRNPPRDVMLSHAEEQIGIRLVLVAAGFADYPLIAFHFSKTGVVPNEWIAMFYDVAMAVSGSGSLSFGRLFDRFGFAVLAALTIVSAAFATLFFWAAIGWL